VNFLRILLSALVWALVIGVILAIAAFVPAIQTAVLDFALHHGTGVKGTVGDVAAAFGKVETDNLLLQFDGAELKAPLIQSEMPIVPAVAGRQFHFHHLAAKGWTLTLHAAAAAQAPAEPPDVVLARAITALLSSPALPYDIQIDTAELEGDIVIAAPKGKVPGKIHVVMNGGGLSAGHQADFAIDATGSMADPNLPLYAASIHGHLLLNLEASRILSRIELKTGLAAKGMAVQQDLQMVGDFAASRTADSVVYSVDLTSHGRRFVSLLAHGAGSAGQLSGTWKVDLRDTDFGLFAGDHDLPVGSATGEGRFEAIPARLQVRAMGSLKIGARHLESMSPALAPVSSLTVDATFDVTHRGDSLKINRLAIAATGLKPLGTARLRQPFTIDETTWDYKPSDPKGPWAEGTIQGIPLGWITTEIVHGLSITGGELSGGWVVRTVPGGFFVDSLSPFAAKGIGLQWNGATVIEGLDCSVRGSATHTENGWQMQWSPLTLSRGGAVIGHVTAEFTPPAEGESMTKVKGKWDLDGAALLPQVDPANREWLRSVRSASADFTGRVGMGSIFDANLTVVGSAPDTSLAAAAMHTELGADGSSSFTVPLKLKSGTVQSDLLVEGTWSGALSGSRLRLKLFGGTVVAEQMGGIAGWWAQRLKPAGPGPAAGIPFWGRGLGSILFTCDHLMVQKQEYKDVSGSIEYEPTGLILQDGHVRYGNNNVTDARATLTYNPGAPVPYQLKATAGLGDIEAKTFLPKPARGEDPLLEGRFAVKASLASSGRDQPELLQNLDEIFSLSSKSGIVRFLKVSVADVIPQHASTVGDTLGSVGNKVGSLLGMEGRIGSGKNPVTPAAQNMVDFSYHVAEIGYDQLSLTAVRKRDGSIELRDIKLVAPDETLTGSGRIAAAAGVPITAAPLSLDWDLGFHGHPAELLAKAKLLTYKKDAPGYAPLSPRIHVGGTLEHPDLKQWHDLLARAAK
jgi:hypothetical protein